MDMQETRVEPTSLTDPVALRSVYLKRLQRLQRLRRQHLQELNKQGLRLLDRTVFAAYCACREVGAEEEAIQILQGGIQGLDPTSHQRAS